MLARRFTIVCLAMMLFGMWFSGFVANADRRVAPSAAGAPCLIADTPACRARMAR
jgi:hypothetical protein